ncbi:MAG: phenylalanine--tRNA ligase subunit beta, partial [Acidobacteriota bacterium]|nr:phenylalanine--tRNA ligase subunit beta [Acidobacteriota bacterium]
GPLPHSEPIALPIDFVVRKLGKELSEAEVSAILSSLGFGVGQTAPGLLTVTVPTWRATKDIELKDDLVEEVGRMIGYGEIVPVPPLVQSVVPPSNPTRLFLRRVRSGLADQGFSEVYNYSFITAADAQRFHMSLADRIGVRNPIASEWTHLRSSLLPGLFNNIVANVRHYSEFRLFEIGNEIHPASNSEMPEEVTHLAAVLYDAHGDEQSFFELKRALECVFPSARLMGAKEVEPYEHPSRAAEVYWRDTRIGRVFELHPSLFAAEGIEGRAIFFDVDLQLALRLSVGHQTKYTPLRKYPTSGFDLSVVAGTKTPVGLIEEQLLRLGGERLAGIDFIRQYDGPPLLEEQKSVSFHLEIGAKDHTLTSEEVSAVREQIVRGMLAGGFEIRGLDQA